MPNRTTPFADLPELLTPEEFRAYAGISRNGIYDLVRRGEIGHVRYGRLIRIPKTALQAPGSDGAKTRQRGDNDRPSRAA